MRIQRAPPIGDRLSLARTKRVEGGQVVIRQDLRSNLTGGDIGSRAPICRHRADALTPATFIPHAERRRSRKPLGTLAKVAIAAARS
jgi:hypothetical protein